LLSNTKQLEYTFKNSAREAANTIALHDYNMTLRTSEGELVIPYANIMNVRLCKVSESLYRTVLVYNDHKTLVITNQYVASNGGTEDRSRIYSTFIRVLHFHLKDKSKALYKSGCSMEKLWRSSIAAATGSFILCFTADLLGFNIFNPYIDAIALSALFIMMLFMLQLGRLPKDYSATNIPFELLPAA
jgi:hypothetical protein